MRTCHSVPLLLQQLSAATLLTVALACFAHADDSLVSGVAAHAKVLCGKLRMNSQGVYWCDGQLNPGTASYPIALSADTNPTSTEGIARIPIKQVISNGAVWASKAAPKVIAQALPGDDLTVLWTTNGHENSGQTCVTFFIEPEQREPGAPLTDYIKWHQPENMIGIATFGASQTGGSGISSTGTRCVDYNTAPGMKDIVKNSGLNLGWQSTKVCHATIKLPSDLSSGTHRLAWRWTQGNGDQADAWADVVTLQINDHDDDKKKKNNNNNNKDKDDKNKKNNNNQAKKSWSPSTPWKNNNVPAWKKKAGAKTELDADSADNQAGANSFWGFGTSVFTTQQLQTQFKYWQQSPFESQVKKDEWLKSLIPIGGKTPAGLSYNFGKSRAKTQQTWDQADRSVDKPVVVVAPSEKWPTQAPPVVAKPWVSVTAWKPQPHPVVTPSNAWKTIPAAVAPHAPSAPWKPVDNSPKPNAWDKVNPVAGWNTPVPANSNSWNTVKPSPPPMSNPWKAAAVVNAWPAPKTEITAWGKAPSAAAPAPAAAWPTHSPQPAQGSAWGNVAAPDTKSNSWSNVQTSRNTNENTHVQQSTNTNTNTVSWGNAPLPAAGGNAWTNAANAPQGNGGCAFAELSMVQCPVDSAVYHISGGRARRIEISDYIELIGKDLWHRTITTVECGQIASCTGTVASSNTKPFPEAIVPDLTTFGFTGQCMVHEHSVAYCAKEQTMWHITQGKANQVTRLSDYVALQKKNPVHVAVQIFDDCQKVSTCSPPPAVPSASLMAPPAPAGWMPLMMPNLNGAVNGAVNGAWPQGQAQFGGNVQVAGGQGGAPQPINSPMPTLWNAPTSAPQPNAQNPAQPSPTSNNGPSSMPMPMPMPMPSGPSSGPAASAPNANGAPAPAPAGVIPSGAVQEPSAPSAPSAPATGSVAAGAPAAAPMSAPSAPLAPAAPTGTTPAAAPAAPAPAAESTPNVSLGSLGGAATGAAAPAGAPVTTPAAAGTPAPAGGAADAGAAASAAAAAAAAGAGGATTMPTTAGAPAGADAPQDPDSDSKETNNVSAKETTTVTETQAGVQSMLDADEEDEDSDEYVHQIGQLEVEADHQLLEFAREIRHMTRQHRGQASAQGVRQQSERSASRQMTPGRELAMLYPEFARMHNVTELSHALLAHPSLLFSPDRDGSSLRLDQQEAQTQGASYDTPAVKELILKCGQLS